MNILVTNDDGIFAKGILELAKIASNFGNVYIIAPDSQKSAISHGISINNPIMVKKVKLENFPNAYSVSGTPADCVKIGCEEILKDINVDLVLSGINIGPNLGTDVIYSGTVSAAIEASIIGIPSIAFSYNSNEYDPLKYMEAREYIKEFMKMYEGDISNFSDIVLNINIPNLKEQEFKGFKSCCLGERKYENAFVKRKDPRGNNYYWMYGQPFDEEIEGSDLYYIKKGYVTITPIKYDFNDSKNVKILENFLQGKGLTIE